MSEYLQQHIVAREAWLRAWVMSLQTLPEPAPVALVPEGIFQGRRIAERAWFVWMPDRRMGVLANYVVLPVAVAEQNGSAPFHLNRYESASSLLPFVPKGLARWIGGADLAVIRSAGERLKDIDRISLEVQTLAGRFGPGNLPAQSHVGASFEIGEPAPDSCGGQAAPEFFKM